MSEKAWNNAVISALIHFTTVAENIFEDLSVRWSAWFESLRKSNDMWALLIVLLLSQKACKPLHFLVSIHIWENQWPDLIHTAVPRQYESFRTAIIPLFKIYYPLWTWACTVMFHGCLHSRQCRGLAINFLVEHRLSVEPSDQSADLFTVFFEV